MTVLCECLPCEDRFRGKHLSRLNIIFVNVLISAAIVVLIADGYIRNWLFFILLSGAGILLFANYIFFDISNNWSWVVYTTLLLAFTLRVSGYLRTVYSGTDHQALYNNANLIVNSGEVVAGGLYGSAPIYLINISIVKLLLRIDTVNIRFVSILYSTAAPLLIISVLYQIYGISEITVSGGLIASFFPLGLRTSALIEAEFLVLIFTPLSFYFLYKYISDESGLFGTLLSGLIFIINLTHFYYGLALTVIFCLAFISIRLLEKARRNHYLNIPRISHFQALTQPHLDISRGVLLWTGLLIAISIPYYILISDYSRHSIGTITGMADSLEVSSIYSIFIPVQNTAARGTGGGETDPVLILIKFYPVIILLLFGLLGMYYVHSDPIYFRFYTTTTGLTLGTGLFTIAILVISAGYQLGYQFRTYYLTGTVIVLLSAIGVGNVLRYLNSHSNTLSIVMVILIAGFLLTGNTVPLGNDVDPKFGGDSFSMNLTEYEELQLLNDHINIYHDSSEIVTDDSVAVHRKLIFAAPSTSTSRSSYLISTQECRTSNMIYATPTYTICSS